ncbi:hypothetical protein ACLDXR_17525 [Acinetobacter baumannii]
MALAAYGGYSYVHGGIRHLEISRSHLWVLPRVHGGIRHLESYGQVRLKVKFVHGGIRHLEK